MNIQRRYGFRAAKSLGQNFLTDKNTIDHIIEYADIGENDLVIEIGPGMGVLTAAAADKAAFVVAVELDQRLIPILEDNLTHYNNIQLINADILKTDVNGIIKARRTDHSSVKIIGNLPYYITNPIIMKLLEDKADADSMTFMLQKEAAVRICAEPGAPDCGAVSAAVRFYCVPHIVMSVSREVFVPRPNVDSSVIRLDLTGEKAVAPLSEKMFFAVVRAGFGQRRKTLLNSLTGMSGFSKDDVGRILTAAGVNPARRAETLNIHEISEIADAAVDVLNTSTANI